MFLLSFQTIWTYLQLLQKLFEFLFLQGVLESLNEFLVVVCGSVAYYMDVINYIYIGLIIISLHGIVILILLM